MLRNRVPRRARRLGPRLVTLRRNPGGDTPSPRIKPKSKFKAQVKEYLRVLELLPAAMNRVHHWVASTNQHPISMGTK